jgi:HK97 family phage major capsid protein
VEQTTSAVEATPVEAPAVEAARPTVTAMAYTKPRIEITAGKYAEQTIRASMGDESARQYLLAADDTTDNAGLVPTRQLSEIINPLGTTIRPSIEAISRGVLPDAGMTFEIPKITAMPTVAVTAEDAAFNETDQTSAFLSVDVKKYAGQQTFSVELLDRTSPAFFDELVRNMAAAYAKATDKAVNAAIITGASVDATTTVTYPTAADNTTDNAGLVPTRQLSEIINPLGTTIRPSIEAISRGVLPDAGMTFEIPKITAMPAVAVAAEDAAFQDTDQTSAFLSVDVKKYAGQQTFSVELLDRTSPAFFDELVRNMAAAYAKATDAAVNAAIITGATADATTTTTYPTAAELLGIVARGAASVYGATLGLANPFARNMIVNTSQWSNIMTLNDAGRPIYTASQPQNAGGSVAPTSLQGNVAGLNLYVTPNTASGTDTDGSILIVNPDAYTWYESPTYRLRAESTAAGQITIGYYGYGAIATKVGAGAFKNNKA